MDSTVSFPDLLKDKLFTVGEYIDFLNNVLVAGPVSIRGEIGAKTNIYSRFGYFSVLDSNGEALLNCFAWKDVIDAVGFPLEEGMEVKIHGFPSIYKKKGSFSFQVKEIELVGEGALKKQYDRLKTKLEVEGLFDSSYKKAIRSFPSRIGLITSAKARGAKRDFLHNLISRNIDISFFDVRVEGERAVLDIVSAIQWFNQHKPDLDVIVITRGGGSWESLQAFNTEDVARAIFASQIPIIVGVGHEDDVTIADYVCDYRASTPTDAAKYLSASWLELPFEVDQYKMSLHAGVSQVILNVSYELERFKERFKNVVTVKIGTINQALKVYQEVFELSNPSALLEKGYSIVRLLDGTIVTSGSRFEKDDVFVTQFHDGCVESKIITTIKRS